MNRLWQHRESKRTTGLFKTAKFTPLQAVARGITVKDCARAYIRGRAVRRVDQLPGLPMPTKVQVFRGGVAFDDCLLLPFPFSSALQAWLISQVKSWSDAARSEEEAERVVLILRQIERAYSRFLG